MIFFICQKLETMQRIWNPEIANSPGCDNKFSCIQARCLSDERGARRCIPFGHADLPAVSQVAVAAADFVAVQNYHKIIFKKEKIYMKSWKKLISLALVLVMALSLSLTAFAAPNSGVATISVNNGKTTTVKTVTLTDGMTLYTALNNSFAS